MRAGIGVRWSLALMVALVTPAAGQGAQDAGPRPVVLISIDGLRPDAIDAFRLRTLQRLKAQGAWAEEARTVLPSTTLPSHTSMLTGVSPAVHGITWNRHIPRRGVVEVPTIFELARAHGRRVAAFFAKSKLRHLDRPHSYDFRLAPLWNTDQWMATDLVPEVVTLLRQDPPDLLFVHIAEPDYAGHMAGWMGWLYRLAARRADAAVAEILMAADAAYGGDGYIVLVTADHGGHGRTHGRDDPRDVLIPWIVHGPGVSAGALAPGIQTMDTGATVLWLLDVPVPHYVEGRPVVEAFGGGAPRYQRARVPRTSMWMKGPLTRLAR